MTTQPDPEYHPSVFAPLASNEQLREQKFGVHAVAKMFGVSAMTVYRLVNEGDLRSYRIGRQIRIPLSAVRQYLGEAAESWQDE